MNYYFIQKSKSYYTEFGTSGPSIHRNTMDIEYNTQGWLKYEEPVELRVSGEQGESKLQFSKLEYLEPYLIILSPVLLPFSCNHSKVEIS